MRPLFHRAETEKKEAKPMPSQESSKTKTIWEKQVLIFGKINITFKIMPHRSNGGA